MKPFFYFFVFSILFFGCSNPPKADFTYTPDNPKSGEEVHFINHSEDARTYSWNLGDMSISDEENPVHIYQDTGTYIVDLFAIKGLMSDEKTVTIYIK